MRSFFVVVLFLALIFFSVYWFNDQNANRNDFSKIPYVGPYFEWVADNYQNIWDFTSRGPSAILGNFPTQFTASSGATLMNGLAPLQQAQQDADSDLGKLKDLYQQK